MGFMRRMAALMLKVERGAVYRADWLWFDYGVENTVQCANPIRND